MWNSDKIYIIVEKLIPQFEEQNIFDCSSGPFCKILSNKEFTILLVGIIEN